MGQFVDRGAILVQFQNSHGRFFGCGRQSSSVCEMHMGFWSIWSWTWWSRQFICDCAFPAFRAWLTHSFKSQLYGYDKGRSTTQFLSRREVDRGAILAQFQNSHGRFFGCGRQSSSVWSVRDAHGFLVDLELDVVVASIHM